MICSGQRWRFSRITRTVGRKPFAPSAISAVALSSFLLSCATMSQGSRSAASPQSAPLILAREDLLAAARQRIKSGDPSLRPAYDGLIRSADRALVGDPPTVMSKRRIPPSGDKHDYMSLAPYWWPDSTKPNGLPYIQRDGIVNPDSRLDHDGVRLQTMIGSVEALSLAYYFTGKPDYARRAETLLRVWFIDSATRMNPNLNYAQAVPGIAEGRGIGIIDTRDIPRLVDAIRLLNNASAIRPADYAAIVSWCRSYLAWLRDSKNGKEEHDAANNHGVWYDAQAVALALFTGDTSLAKTILTTDTRRRIESQISADGSQPGELERTRPMHYSVFTLDAYTQLAEMARRVGVELWDYQAPSGGSLRKALLFIAPYADSSLRWIKPDVTPVPPEAFATPLRRAAVALGDPRFAAVLATLRHGAPDSSRAALFYPPAAGTLPPLRDPPAAGTLSPSLALMADSALREAAVKLKRSATTLDPANGYPRFVGADGRWTQQSASQWTSGFFAGTLWYMYELTRAPEWRTLAERWTVGLEENKTRTSTHDLGFIIFDSFGHGYVLTGDPRYREVVLTAARSLTSRYNPRVGAIKSWDTEQSNDRRGSWKYPVIVDNLMNLELLFWSAAAGGNPEWKVMAERHAITSAAAHVRANGSTNHVALFDPVSGKLEQTTTWQGYSDSSTWARGQAWAINGFTNAYRRTGRPELLRAAERAADWFIAHLPSDGIPYWDFSDPRILAVKRDASAAAIAASGLLDLARSTSPSLSARYKDAAQRILVSLRRGYTAGPGSAALLEHSVGGLPQDSEVDVGIVYADYFYIEALLRLKGIFLE